MELTDEMIEDATKCDTCGGCSMKCDTLSSAIRKLSSALKSERAKPNVWDGAPDDATKARVEFFSPKYANFTKGKEYTRELPKSRERLIAEKTWGALHRNESLKDMDIGIIEAAIIEAKGSDK